MKRIISIILAMLMLLSLVACGKSAETKWQEQYDLGVRYLSDGNYEEAVIAFTAAIEIDPKREEAYVGLADVYYATGNTAKAEEILAQRPTQDIVSTKRYDFEDGGYYICEYNASGKCVRETWYNADNMVHAIVEYDTSRNHSRTTHYNTDGTVDYYLVIKYDEFGNCVRMTKYNADGTMDHYSTYEYDATGNRVREIYYNADGTVRSVTEY